MPYVNIKVIDDNVTRQQKPELVQRTTQMLVEVLDKDPKSIFVVIDEINSDNWGYDGSLVSGLIRRQGPG